MFLVLGKRKNLVQKNHKSWSWYYTVSCFRCLMFPEWDKIVWSYLYCSVFIIFSFLICFPKTVEKTITASTYALAFLAVCLRLCNLSLGRLCWLIFFLLFLWCKGWNQHSVMKNENVSNFTLKLVSPRLGFFVICKLLRIYCNASPKLNPLQNAIPVCCAVRFSIFVWPSIASLTLFSKPRSCLWQRASRCRGKC